MSETKTMGELKIRTKFSANDEVSKIKNAYADLYNQVLGLITWRETTAEDIEEVRLVTKALEDLETSAMYAVKGLTVRL